jgi:GT2 family glycosyltransferase
MSGRPFVSIVVPTHRRPEPLARCLAALARQSYDAAEVIVVADGEECVADAERAIAASGHPRARAVSQPNRGPASARNRGVTVAEGDLLLFTDDDCEPDARWTEEMVAASSASPACILGGATNNRRIEDVYADASQLLVAYLYGYYNRDAADARFFTSNNLAVPREVFTRLGGFDERFRLTAGEDRDFCDRARAEGVRLCFAPRALVGHAHALTLRTFVRQHRDYGRGAALFHRLRAERRRARVRLEPLRFYAGLMTWPVGRVPAARLPWTMALMATSQIANAAGYFAAPRS